MANPIYTALCPACGAAIYAPYGGLRFTQCTTCAWAGQAAFHFLPGSGGQNSGGVGFLSGMSGMSYPTLAPLPGPTPEQPEPDPLEARRAALSQRLARLTVTVAELLHTVDTEQWQYPAWRDYERLQEAHAALYTALGGARMGEYHPARATLDEALASVLLWALLTLDAVER